MADYQAQIRLAVEGLPQLNRLNSALERATELLGNLENAQVYAGQIGESATRNVNSAVERRRRAQASLTRAQQTVANTAMRRDPATGQIVGGGPNATARRLAGRQLRLAQRELREADRNLGQEIQNRRVIDAAERRYARALDRTAAVIGGTQGSIQEQQARIDQAMRGIGRGSRGNYLTNLFQGRQAEFARGGGGANLPAALQEQARSVRAAWDVATAGGRENLRLMSRLATEMAGLTRQQNELNRSRTNRSGSFEAGRRGQERIDDLSRMPGADPARVRRLRSQATAVISAGYTGDQAATQLATRRMNASINRYGRELTEAANQLQQQRRAGVRSLNVRQSWQTALAEGRQGIMQGRRIAGARNLNVRQNWATALEQGGTWLSQNRRALPSRELLAERIARTPGGVAPTRLDELKKEEAKAAEKEAKGAEKQSKKRRYWTKLEEEQKRQAALGIGVSMPERIGGPRRRVNAIPMGGGADSGIMPRALPSKEIFEALIGGTGRRMPTRLDELKKKEAEAAEEAKKKADKELAESGKRLAAARKAEAERLDALGLGPGTRESRARARMREAGYGGGGGGRGGRRGGGIPMPGEGGFNQNQYNFPAGPGNAKGIAAFNRAQPKPAPGFFRGDARQAIGEGLIGGAFPLLFGQGAGASVGGLAGGALGGAIGGSFGFGLSLVGTAIGTAVDTTAQNLKDLAAALKSPDDAIAALETSGFRVGDALKFQVQQLQSVGRAYDAQTLVLQEVERRLGPGSITELRELDAAQKRLQESWAAIGAEIQTRLLPVLQGFLEFLGSAAGDIGGFASQSRLQRLDPETFGRLRDQAIKETSGPLGMFGDKKAYDARLNELAKQELSGRFQNERAKVPLSPQEAFAKETAAVQESRRIADQIQSAYRESFNLQRQAHDLQYDGAKFNKEVADYIYGKERQIFDLRQQAAEKQIENSRGTAQNRIERSDLNARQVFAAAVGFEQQLLSNVRESMRTRMEGEADIEQSRRRLELAMAKLNRDIEDYKRTNAREIEDIERRKLAYIRSVEDYKKRVADYVLQRSRESADLMRQAMSQGEVGGTGGGAIGNAAYTPVSPLRQIPYLSQIDKAAKEANVDPRLFAGLVQQESAFNPSARSSSGAIGLAQLMPGTAQELGVDPLNIQENLRGGAKYLRQMIDRFGLEGGLRAYNQGPSAQQRTPSGNSRESREYPGKVLANARALGFNPATAAAPATMGGVARLPGSISGRLDASGQNGADMPVGPNNEIRSYHSGVVRQIGQAGRNGNFAVIEFIDDLGNRLEATYSHMAAIVKVGQQVTGGQVLGRYDASGRTSGPHNSVDINSPGTNGALQRNAETAAARRSADILVTGRVQGSSALQAAAAGQIGNTPAPQFTPTPVGPTPAAAPLNAANLAAQLQLKGGEKEAQRILEEQIALKQKGVELGQIEQILQSNQLPQLQQQGNALQQQIEARRQVLGLSDNAASMADIEAESNARIAQIEKDRSAALGKIQQQYKGDATLVKQVNTQADLALNIAKKEEEQRRKNLELSNQRQNQDRVRSEILQLQEVLALANVEAAALERGELEAGNVERLKASTLYQQASEAEKEKLSTLVAQTEELRRQNEFNRRMNEMRQERQFTGAGLRAGFVGAPARAFEEGMKQFDGNTQKATDLANQAKLLEDQQLIWSNLEKNIVDVSNAISGALTNGLVDIVSGAKKIEDVGRDMLNGIARSFADAAQQQLTTLLQRQLGGLLGGAGGPLTRLAGAGVEAAGPQALGAASAMAAGQVTAFGVALQTVMAQMALSGAMGGAGSGVSSAVMGGLKGAFSSSAPSLLGSAVPNLIPGFSPTYTFGGFFANGGITRPNEGYVVGENEPEFFFPGVSGRVVPRSDMQKAEELRQGNEQNDPIDVRYTVTEQRGERYVTEEQFRKGMAQTSRKAQAMTYAGMRNNRDVRNFVDI